MTAKLETLSPVRRRVRFTIAGTQVDGAFRSVVGKLAQTVRIPGFRPGKVPPQVVERQFAVDVRNRVLDKLLKDHVFTAIEQTGAKAISPPEVDAISELAKGMDLEVSAQFEVMAQLVLTGYQGAALSCPQITMDQADIDAELATRLKTQTEMVGTDGPAVEGDKVVISYKLTQGDLGAPYQTVEDRETSLDPVGVPMPVLQAFVGKLAGEVVDATVMLADDTQDMVRVTGSMTEISRAVVPALDDELAKDLGFDDLPALTADVQTLLAKKVEAANKQAREQAAVKHLVAVNDVPVPQSMVERHVDDQMQNLMQQLGDVGRQMQDFMRSYRGTLMTEARKQLQRSLAIDGIADAHDLQVSDEEAQAELDKMVAENPKQAAATLRHYGTTAGKGELKFGLRNRKATELLIGEAQWTVTETLSLQQWAALARGKEDAEAGDAHDHDHGHEHGADQGHVHGPDCDHDHDDDAAHASAHGG